MERFLQGKQQPAGLNSRHARIFHFHRRSNGSKAFHLGHVSGKVHQPEETGKAVVVRINEPGSRGLDCPDHPYLFLQKKRRAYTRLKDLRFCRRSRLTLFTSPRELQGRILTSQTKHCVALQPGSQPSTNPNIQLAKQESQIGNPHRAQRLHRGGAPSMYHDRGRPKIVARVGDSAHACTRVPHAASKTGRGPFDLGRRTRSVPDAGLSPRPQVHHIPPNTVGAAVPRRRLNLGVSNAPRGCHCF